MLISRRHIVRLALALPFVGASRTLAQHQDPPDHGRFYVVGHVVRPGAYHYEQNMTVGGAIDAAGGPDPRYSVDRLEIVRVTNGEKEALRVTFNDAVLPNDTVAIR